MLDRSQAALLSTQPFKADEAGNVTQTLAGVFLLLSRDLVDTLKAELTAAQKDELESYVYPLSEAQAGDWHVPVWARAPGEAAPSPAAVYIRIPAAVWSDPATPPPLRVKRLLRWLWREVPGEAG